MRASRLHEAVQSRLKRCIDLMLAGAGILVTAPVLLLAALIVRITMGSPCIFRQERAGLGGRLFELYKLRTMNELRDDSGKLLPDQQRLTWAGRVIRKTSVDELPQLWNVLRGDMSMVGPRPLLPKYLPLYTVRQMRRHEVKPGITGWAQINGRNALQWEQKFELDLWYAENWSLLLDLKIIVLTVPRILKSHGISQPGHETMEEFFGSGEYASATISSESEYDGRTPNGI